MESLLKEIIEKLVELISIMKIENVRHDRDREYIKNSLDRIEKLIKRENEGI